MKKIVTKQKLFSTTKTIERLINILKKDNVNNPFLPNEIDIILQAEFENMFNSFIYCKMAESKDPRILDSILYFHSDSEDIDKCYKISLEEKKINKIMETSIKVERNLFESYR